MRHYSLRLTVSHLKCRDVVAHGGLRIPPEVKEELVGGGGCPDLNVVDALDGFSLVLSQEGDVIHVSNNVTNFIGLSSFELLGNAFSEFVHPCDHEQLKKLHPQGAEPDAHVEVNNILFFVLR
jgi:PAS domain-containing protein